MVKDSCCVGGNFLILKWVLIDFAILNQRLFYFCKPVFDYNLIMSVCCTCEFTKVYVVVKKNLLNAGVQRYYNLILYNWQFYLKKKKKK